MAVPFSIFRCFTNKDKIAASALVYSPQSIIVLCAILSHLSGVSGGDTEIQMPIAARPLGALLWRVGVAPPRTLLILVFLKEISCFMSPAPFVLQIWRKQAGGRPQKSNRNAPPSLRRMRSHSMFFGSLTGSLFSKALPRWAHATGTTF